MPGRLVIAAGNEAPQLAFCWSRARRKLYDIHVATKPHSLTRRCGGSPLSMRSRRRMRAPTATRQSMRSRWSITNCRRIWA